jgi:hypothetical protein
MTALNQLAVIRKAKFPDIYNAARKALSECSRIDECQQWADKAEALASYAKQAKDEQLKRLADRIQARAIRRCGELLKQIPQANGARTDLELQDGSDPKLTRESAATDAGLSERQRKTALRVASVPEAEFLAQVESDDPPTITALAEQGKTESVTPATPAGLSDLRKFANFCGRNDPASLALAIAACNDADKARAWVGEIDSWLDQFITNI